jgi:DUF971 family protein
MNPTKIKVTAKPNNKDKKDLFIKWDDGTESRIDLKYLRDECPCATCKGETVLLKNYKPLKDKIEVPGMYEIKNIEMAGNYAVQITWKDGHNTGIYSWVYLKKLDEDQSGNKTQDYEKII